ncbi:MAG: glycosyltransferase [Gemmatimonadales bacterium]|nr:glycosyltransferase [Gemmatimonadales bacterium]
MGKNALSLCMIVRDAEETIGRALASVQGVVDEMIVVDTGSTDTTRSIAESYGALIIDFPWVDDFSAARNVALEAATADWILILDSDEILADINSEVIRRILDDDEALAYYVRIRETGQGVPDQTYEKVRIFRSHPEVRYRFLVHEQIVPSLLELADRNGGRFLKSDLRIEHSGSSNRREKGKSERNRRLLHKAIAETPEDPFFHFQLALEFAVYLADEVMPVKGFSQLVAELEIAVDLMDQLTVAQTAGSGYGAEAYALLANAYLSANRSTSALATCEKAIARFGEPSSLRYFHGRALLAMAAAQESGSAKRRRQGIARLETLGDGGEDFDPSPISPRHFSLYPLRYLGLAAMEEGRFEDARALFQQALQIDPTYTGASCGLARLEDRLGHVGEAMRIYIDVIKANDAEWAAWRGGAELLKRMGRVEEGNQWGNKLHSIFPELGNPSTGTVGK